MGFWVEGRDLDEFLKVEFALQIYGLSRQCRKAPCRVANAAAMFPFGPPAVAAATTLLAAVARSVAAELGAPLGSAATELTPAMPAERTPAMPAPPG